MVVYRQDASTGPAEYRLHIANSLTIDQDDFEYAPFYDMGGLGAALAL